MYIPVAVITTILGVVFLLGLWLGTWLSADSDRRKFTENRASIEKKANYIFKILALWQKKPEWTFGKLISEGVFEATKARDSCYITNGELRDGISRVVNRAEYGNQ